VPAVQGFSKREVRFDLADLHTPRQDITIPSLVIDEVRPQVSVGRLSRRPPPCHEALEGVDDVGVVDVEFDLHAVCEDNVLKEMYRPL
jgi:hypothetical protein